MIFRPTRISCPEKARLLGFATEGPVSRANGRNNPPGEPCGRSLLQRPDATSTRLAPVGAIDLSAEPTEAGVPGAALAARPATATSVQVNDPALDNIQFFPNALPQPQRPYEFSTQSETSAAAFGDDVVVGFNNSADQPVTLTPQNTVAFVHASSLPWVSLTTVGKPGRRARCLLFQAARSRSAIPP